MAKRLVRKPRLLNRNILDPRTSLGTAKEYMRQRIEEGVHCVLCEQYARVYRRKLNSGMAQALVMMYRAAGLDWCYRPDVLRDLKTSAHDNTLLHYWGLWERGDEVGWWRVTTLGEEFIRDEIEVPRFAVIYNSELLRLDGPWIDIHQALGDKFDLDELMRR